MIETSRQSRPSVPVRLAVALCWLLLLVPAVSAQKVRRKATTPPPAPPKVTAQELKELDEAASQSRAHLIETSQNYRQSLERLLVLQREEEERATAAIEKSQNLFELGVIAKRQLEESEQKLAEAKGRAAETQRQIDSVDHLIAEVNAAEQLAKMPSASRNGLSSTAMLVRFIGASRWSMSDIDKVDAFFRLKFGTALPVSALGQTETHSRLGLDHHNAIDVAIHPDSPEGGALISYLRSQGISFIAIRGAIPGSATGAHIHIGLPSKRLTAP
ncbi:MAG TPA: hypothetical protein VJ302_10290 [Blastocatellia bacterium]|nr:hypothetical protein [Blastocatellia bacterium]